MTDVVGSASFELRAERKRLKEDLAASKNDLNVFVNDAEKSVSGGAGKMGGAIGKFVGIARTGLTAVAALFAIAAVGAVNFSLAAVKMGSDLADSAKRVNIGTEALQEWRYVARQSGEDASAADRAIDGFQKKLAGAASGLDKEAIKAFATLRFSPEQLRSFENGEAALDAVATRIGDLGSEASRAAVAEKLGLGPLSAALQKGSDDVARLRDEARALGIVMDAELIDRAADAQKQIDTLSQVIDVNLKQAFLDLAPVIIGTIDLVATLAKGLGDALDRFRELDNKTSRGLTLEDGRLAREQRSLIDRFGSPSSMRGQRIQAERVPGGTYTDQKVAARVGGDPMTVGLGQAVDGLFNRGATDARQQFDAINARRLAIAAEQQARSEARRDEIAPRNDPGGGQLVLPPPTERKGPKDRSAELEARRAERFQDDLDRARQRLLGLAEDEADTAQTRFDAAQASIAVERQIRDADLDRQVIAGELTEARRAILAAANAEADALEDRFLTDRAFREIDEERLATERLLSGLASDLLSLQAGGARTAAERRRIELELLEIAQRERRDALARELDRRNATAAQRSAAFNNLDQIDSAENSAVIRNTLSPLDRWRDQALTDADQIREAYEDVAARGLDALNDGIVDAIVNSRNLGDVFSNVAKQIIADLAAIAVRRSITEPLANLLFGGGSGGSGGGGGGFFSSLVSFGSRFLGGGSAVSSAGEGGLLPGRLLGSPVLPIAGPKTTDSLGSIGLPAGGLAQRMEVVVTSDDPKFRAFVRKEAMPLSENAYSRAMTGAPKLTMSQTAQQQQHTVGRKMR